MQHIEVLSTLYHEAGHVIANAHYGRLFHEIWFGFDKEEGRFDGLTVFVDSPSLDLLPELVTNYAGIVAQRLYETSGACDMQSLLEEVVNHEDQGTSDSEKRRHLLVHHHCEHEQVRVYTKAVARSFSLLTQPEVWQLVQDIVGLAYPKYAPARNTCLSCNDFDSALVQRLEALTVS